MRPFASRIASPRAWTRVAFDAGRWQVAVVLAAAPALVLVVTVAVSAPLAESITDPQRVREAFARFISGIITAATIAVGFASLAMRRGIKGLGELQEHLRADELFAERVRAATGSRHPPAAVGPLLAELLDAVARAARHAPSGSTPEFLAGLERHAREAEARVRAAGGEPDALLRAALDFEPETAMDEAKAHGMEELLERLRLAGIARSYVKTLATQWGLSRMSRGIALSAFLAVSVATGMVLAYGRIEPAIGSGAIVAAALFFVLLPLAVFVSFVLRFIFVNEHSLPLGPFVLGPENPEAVKDNTRGGRAPRSPGRHA